MSLDTQLVNLPLHKARKFAEPARNIFKTKMLPQNISILCRRSLGRIDNVALKRRALFTVE
jgi:hypothetical protein